jgi:hypothetical protein
MTFVEAIDLSSGSKLEHLVEVITAFSLELQPLRRLLASLDVRVS